MTAKTLRELEQFENLLAELRLGGEAIFSAEADVRATWRKLRELGLDGMARNVLQLEKEQARES